MAVLNATAIDYSLLAGAESLDGVHQSSSLRHREGADAATTATLSSDEDDTASEELSPSASGSSSEDEAAASITQSRSVKSAAKPVHVVRLPQKVSQDPNDWLWMHNEEPHRSRRRAILQSHPEVTKLMGYEPWTKYAVLLVVSIQFLTAFFLRDTSPLSWKFVLAAYAIGGTCNQNLFLAIHEITHNLAFKGIKANRTFAMFANLPIGIPYAMMFKKYHMEHHRALGVDGVDTDLPTRLELLCLRNVAGKAFFCIFQILFYALRPGFVRAQTLTRWHAFNLASQFGFDALLVYASTLLSALPADGSWNFRPLLYFIMSSFFAGSLHPCAGHFIAEHHLFDQWDQETWSYYGCLNYLTYNVGYHNEHHDFPSIPWTRLPALHSIANEYYKDLPRHDSWCMVTYRFIFDTDVGLFSRVKRMPKAHGDTLEAIAHAGGTGNLGGLKDE